MARALAALLAVAATFALLPVTLDLHRLVGEPWMAGGIVFLMTLALGLPVLVFFCRRQWWEPWRFALGGTLGGALCALPFAHGLTFSLAYLMLLLACAGFAAGLSFWGIGIWRNDDLTCPKEFRLPGGAAYKVARNALRRRAA
ncbi:MAG: hypothetical protein JNK22_17820 [Rhodocyclaceae bacterium]|nr:hypothetical protein [Rhodocyclaceae bacterium]